jgi:hypothetical protein
MKVIATLQGVSVLLFSADDAMPVGGVLLNDMVSVVSNAYKFTAVPTFPPGVPFQLMPILQFQNGELSVDGAKFVISQITITNNAIVVISQTTEASDAVLENVISLLDSSLGFRIGSSETRLTHISNIVVKFDRGLEEYLTLIGQIEQIISSAAPSSPGPFKIKRLTFGREAFNMPDPTIIASPEAAERADFVIERRVGHAFSENRYFCGAPLSTPQHIRVLETIEEMISSASS